jgi:hypothetical protein
MIMVIMMMMMMMKVIIVVINANTHEQKMFIGPTVISSRPDMFLCKRKFNVCVITVTIGQ